ncbi:unannotated protein [freshwater metagenome]|uniref:Unannotated protein n=1 Tax=freshwater metagenome TaxID=449393 RepID=A0A6J6E6X8_9ZZZZ
MLACATAIVRRPDHFRKFPRWITMMQVMRRVQHQVPWPEWPVDTRSRYQIPVLELWRVHDQSRHWQERCRSRTYGPCPPHNESRACRQASLDRGSSDTGRPAARHRRYSGSTARDSSSSDPTRESWSRCSRLVHRQDAPRPTGPLSHLRTPQKLFRITIRRDLLRRLHQRLGRH